MSPRPLLSLAVLIPLAAFTAGCGPSLPPSKPLAQLSPVERQGYDIYQTRCAGCHYAESQSSLHGPGLQGLYKKRFLPSGAPANDDRVTDAIRNGRALMPPFRNNLDDSDLNALLAYLHTL
ncbi:c-type cytochrome [Silvibacterium sp.]|uniref:c-type cytochrome n=1 Tax=Silvibacterium sp. TaxID=1964179 RepID=UPI0039E710EE